jgi:hypothetical protein
MDRISLPTFLPAENVRRMNGRAAIAASQRRRSALAIEKIAIRATTARCPRS